MDREFFFFRPGRGGETNCYRYIYFALIKNLLNKKTKKQKKMYILCKIEISNNSKNPFIGNNCVSYSKLSIISN